MKNPELFSSKETSIGWLTLPVKRGCLIEAIATSIFILLLSYDDTKIASVVSLNPYEIGIELPSALAVTDEFIS